MFLIFIDFGDCLNNCNNGKYINLVNLSILTSVERCIHANNVLYALLHFMCTLNLKLTHLILEPNINKSDHSLCQPNLQLVHPKKETTFYDIKCFHLQKLFLKHFFFQKVDRKSSRVTTNYLQKIYKWFCFCYVYANIINKSLSFITQTFLFDPSFCFADCDEEFECLVFVQLYGYTYKIHLLIVTTGLRTYSVCTFSFTFDSWPIELKLISHEMTIC